MKQLKRLLETLLPYLRLPTVFCAVFLLSSCFGLGMDIELNQNGSGTISLEYRVSKSLDSLGKLDGNQRWNTIPTGLADFERTIARLPEMKLLSFSSKEDQRDIINSAKLSFSSISGLLAFLNAGNDGAAGGASGRRASFAGDMNAGRLFLTLSEGTQNIDPGLMKLMEEISAPYSVKISMKSPGRETVSHSFTLYELLSSPNRIIVELKW